MVTFRHTAAVVEKAVGDGLKSWRSRRLGSPHGWLVASGIALGLVVVVALLLLLFNGRITTSVEGDGFRQMLDKETSKGLKFEGTYSPFSRVGFLGLKADSFEGKNGTKTMVHLTAQKISGWFNPLGIFLRRWQLEDLHIATGTVMLQKTEPTGEKPPGQPWYLFFWPNRVYLADIKVDDANVLFNLREKESGIYHAFLEITPNGRDFEYDAHGGEFRTPMSPVYTVRHVHLLIRKPRLYCQDFVLGEPNTDAAHPGGELRMTGTAGLQQDRAIQVKIDLDALAVSPWLPEKWRHHMDGRIHGHLDYKSTGTGIETAEGGGTLALADGVLKSLAPIRRYVSATKSPDPGDLKLKVCQTDLKWHDGGMEANNLQIESEGVFRIVGNVALGKDKQLHGEAQVGLTAPYLAWLPTARSAIFTRREGAYFFATVHLSGTAQKPEEDLSSQLMAEVRKHPMVGVKLFFNSIGGFFNPE